MNQFLIALFCIFASVSIAQSSDASVNFKITNYESSDQILKLEKLEIGIELPENIERKVSNFVSNQPLDKINPYLEWELKVTAEFMHKNRDSSIFVDGFYSQKYSTHMVKNLPTPANNTSYSREEYASLGGYTKIPSDFNFYVRFAPPETGEWKCKIIVQTENRKYESSFSAFSVVDSDNIGYLKIGKNKRFFELGDSSFYPIGGNAPWPATRTIDDPEFAPLSQYNGVPFPEDYRTTYCLPRVYEKYKNALTNIAEGGSNSFRMIMYPASTDIEWEELGNYTARLHMAQELDEIVEHAKEKKLIIDWNTQIHYSFQYSDIAYFKQWTWDKKINGKPFCYQKQNDSEHPIDFFRNPESIKYFQQKLRYILARWGYSTNIGIFELMSEINNVAESPFEYNAEQRKAMDTTFTEWLKIMGEFVKSHYNGRIHLLTSSYAGYKTKENDVFSEKSMDLMSSNIYDFQTPSFGKFWVDFVSKKQLNDNYMGAYSINRGVKKDRNPKPLIYSETGVLESNEMCDFIPIEMDRLLWQSMFSGVAAAYDWEYWSRKDLSANRNAANFINQYQLDKREWHPGAMKAIRTKEHPSWVYRPKFAKRMEGANKKADLTYLRSGDRNEAIGVITNTTYNIYSVSDCADELYEKKNLELNWPLVNSEIEKVETTGKKSENLKIKHLKNGKYMIEYFLPNDLTNAINTSTGYGPNIKIKHLLGDTQKDYIVIIKVKKL